MKTLGPTLHFFLFFYVTILYQLSLAELKDPYTILGVDRHSSSQEIRRAYKQLAKEWHPDKNTNPDAEERFIKIKQAYELLNDSDRRRIYDQHGITNEDSHFFKQRHDYSHYGRFASDPFEEFFGKNFFFDQDISLYHKLSITTKYFEQYVVLKSRSVPYLLMFYNDWCFRCTRIVGTLKKLIDVLEPLGIHFATVNAAHEQELVRKTGINDVPSLVLIINGNSYVFRDTGYTSQKVVDFIRKKLPHTIFKKIDDSNFEDFLNGWIDNRVRALISEPRNQTRLRYLLSAFSFQYRVAFGFVDLTNDDSKIIQDRFKLHPSLDSLLIFNEDLERPVASVSMSDIPSQTLTNIIASNQFLTLPRLSSQDILEGVCPTEWNRPRKRLCVVLITKNCEQHNYARSALRHIALQSVFSQDRVRYAYIYKEKQIDFVNAISKGKGDDIVLKLVIIWRRDTTHIKYEWIEDTNLKMGQSSVEMEKFVNLTKQTLDKTIHKLLKTSEELTYEATVQNLFDEHAQSYLRKWLAKCLYVAEYLFDNIEQEHILATVSLFGTIALMFGIGYVMVYFVKAEEESIKSKEQQGKHKVKKQDSTTQELKLHELRAEKYNGMVRLLKPGCRTIILISDLQSRANLIPPFHKAVWPYRKSKTLIFGHMLIEKGLAWYSELLRLSLCESKHLQINPRNCVGTVLAINGHRKYFCMYHAKHPESTGGEKRMVKMTRHLLKRTQDPEIGTFVEIENSDDSESDAKVLLEGSLLDGLNNWLDRLFEGTTHRYYINYWPDFPTK